ncbi:MAG TPA: divergent PAP2 family protein [Patescibacteria group bacterium]|jgi:hypothetical protein
MDFPEINPVLLVAGLVWLSAELSKYLIGLVNDRGRKLFDPGGMPSVHTAVIVGCTMAIGLSEGFDSPLFALGAVVSAIVAHDAFRVRWAVGTQAVRINELSRRAKLPPVVVWRGHRIREVIVGGIYGALLAWGLWALLHW